MDIRITEDHRELCDLYIRYEEDGKKYRGYEEGSAEFKTATELKHMGVLEQVGVYHNPWKNLTYHFYYWTGVRLPDGETVNRDSLLKKHKDISTAKMSSIKKDRQNGRRKKRR